MDKAPVFISWSGEASRLVASALRGWLPEVFQTVEPFASAEDIAAGSVWFETIGQELRRSDYAIICVTTENQRSPWLHFEAGAIGMAHSAPTDPTPRGVVPYLLEMSPSDLDPPFSQYQSMSADEAGTRRLVADLNRRVPAPLATSALERTFVRWWPDLAEQLAEASKLVGEGAAERPERNEREMLEEMLALMRQSAQTATRPNARRSPVRPIDLKREEMRVLASLEEAGVGVNSIARRDDGWQVWMPTGRRVTAELLDLVEDVAHRAGFEVSDVSEDPF